MCRAAYAVAGVCALVLAGAVCFALHARAERQAAQLRAPARRRAAIAAASRILISPVARDYPAEITEDSHLQVVEHRGHLAALVPHQPLVGIIGGGESYELLGRLPGTKVTWAVRSCYLLYPTSAAARTRAFEDDSRLHDRAAMPSPGSFTGAAIGDLSGHISDPSVGWYELHFLRHNVYVALTANASVWSTTTRDTDWPRADAARSQLPRVMEQVARVIIGRIDTVATAKGRVDTSNLPPIDLVAGPRNANPPGPPKARPHRPAMSPPPSS